MKLLGEGYFMNANTIALSLFVILLYGSMAYVAIKYPKEVVSISKRIFKLKRTDKDKLNEKDLKI